jgi:hypothetical protein
MTKNSSLSAMGCLVNTTVGIESVFRGREYGIKLGFPDIGVEAVDFV